VAAAITMMAYAFAKLDAAPGAGQILLAILLTMAALMILYSIWILVVCAAFWVVRLDNLAYLFSSIFDFARWPATIFSGTLRVVFTFVIPLALMTTYPAAVLLDRLDERTALLGIGGALAFAAAARLIWLRAIGHYTSASS
jgi:ABC-2 type transport system permease protein